MNRLNDIKIYKGKYKNLSLKVSNEGEIIIKAPRTLSNSKIEEFVNLKQNWINKQMNKINEMNARKSKYNFQNNVYLFGNKINYLDKKNEFYTKAFKDFVCPLVEELSLKCNLQYRSLNITNSRHIWGYLDNNKNMRLNWKILILPKELAVYVIIHELCHSKAFNHSKRFWSLVGEYLPNYKILRKELKDYAFILSDKVL